MPGTQRQTRSRVGRSFFSARLSVALLLAVCGLSPATVGADEITVAAVQFEVSEDIYSSQRALRAELESLLVRARDRFGADIVVFPEYINAFLLAARHPNVLEDAESFQDALSLITGREAGIDALATVFRTHASWIAETATAMWSDLADRHDTVVVAGTVFVPASDEADEADKADGGLRNRLLVFDEAGTLVYTQDKVFLTPYEVEFLRLEPGSIRAAEPLVLDGLEIGFTICRDSFFEAWEPELGGVDLWVDLRANGEPYTREVYARFLGALPERVARTDADAGISASLSGEFLGAVWAGPSYAVDADGRRIAASSRPVGTQITAIRLVERGSEWVPVPVLPAN